MAEETKNIECLDQFCPICKALGKQETLNEVTGLIELSPNPQAHKGVPRVVDCTAGCRFDLEPYFSPKASGAFCYMLIRSERNPEAVVNHYWFLPSCIGKPR